MAETIDEALLLATLRVHVVELVDADGGCLAHVRVLVVDALAQGNDQVLHDLLHANACHRTQCEGSNQGVRILRVADKCVDSQNDQLRLCTGVVDQVSARYNWLPTLQINQFLQLQGLVVDTANHVGEQHRHVCSDRHRRNHTLHRIGHFRRV